MKVCFTRPKTLREEHRLKVFKNVVLRKISGPKREKIITGYRKLHKRCFIIGTLHQLSFI